METGWARFRRRFFSRWPATVGMAIGLAVLLVSVTAPLLFPDDPWMLKGRPFLWPGADARFPLGTDTMGRDILAGLFHGARTTLFIGVTAAVAAALIGTLVGSVAGFYGRLVDDVLMRFTETVQTVPSFILILALISVFSPSIESTITAIGVSTWPPVARLVRGQVMSLRDREFIQSCVAIGMTDWKIVTGQILPNALPPLLAIFSVMVATAILQEASLSFLGLGDPNAMSWGAMIGAGRNSLRTAWYIAAVPGVAIIFTVLSLNLIGEGVNDALNPRLKDK